MINVIQGIEGDDLPYHLKLLGIDINSIGNRYYFFPLNDHYGQHQTDWQQQTSNAAANADVVVFYDLVNTGDYEHDKFCEFIVGFKHPCKVYLTVNQSKNFDIPGVKIIQWDFMWNRIKAYYTESVPCDKLLHHYNGPGQYNLPQLDFDKSKSKVFLSPCGREYGYRTRLYNDVCNYTSGYLSNRTRGIFLEERHITGAFKPIPEEFYANSYFSVYVESNVTKTELIHVTEKSFEPLIKGHFILPIANPGTVQRIRDLGFKLPDFIDYSYDTEQDTDTRYNMVMTEFKRLLDLDWPARYAQHRKDLEFNQTCINVIPYDRRILEVFDV
jgi:hypothetical protein